MWVWFDVCHINVGVIYTRHTHMCTLVRTHNHTGLLNILDQVTLVQ